MNALLAGILAYVLAQLAIGVWVARRIETEDDYLVAGRRLGPGLAMISVFATWFGAETCVGAAGQVYDQGLGRLSVEPFAYGVCLLVMGLVFAAPMWRRRITTLGDLYRQRFSQGVERLAAVILIPTSLFWAAAQVRAFGGVLTTSTDALSSEQAIAIAAVLTTVYTVFGGLLADVVTDVVQGAALVLGLALVTWGVSDSLGGLPAALGSIDPERLPLFGPGQASWMETLEAWALPICGSVVAQEVVSRSLAARSQGIARAAGLGGGALYLLIGSMPVFLGLVGARLVPGLEDGEQVLPRLARTYLPAALYVLFAGALVSAILSTVDSALLAAASLLSRNLFLRESASDRAHLVAARAGVVLFGAAAWFLARRSEGVFALIEYASGFGSAGILVTVSFGLFTRFGGPRAAVASLVLGIATWLGGTEILELRYPYLASLAASLLGYVALAPFERR